MEKARCNTELYSNLRAPFNNVKPSNFWGSHQSLVTFLFCLSVLKEFAEITDSFYSLIRPEPHYYKWFCQRVHGLGPKDTEKAPVFPEVWEKIGPLIEGLPLVAHGLPGLYIP